MVGVAEEREDRFGDLDADAGDDGLIRDAAFLADLGHEEVFGSRGFQRVHGLEVTGEVLGGLHADVRDTERVDGPPELALLRLREPGQHVVDGLLLEAVEHPPFGRGDPQGVHRGVDITEVHELLGHGFAESVDVEALLAGEVDQAADLHLARRGAELVGRLVADADGVEAQFLEPAFEVEGPGVGRASREHDREDLGDDLAGLLDAHRVAFADVLAGDLGGVVQGRAGDGRTREEDRLQFGDRRDHAGAADLHADRAQGGLGLVGREFERHGPVRELARRAGPALVFEAVDLHDGAVGREGQVAAEDVEPLDRGPGRVDALLDVEIVADGKAPVPELRLERLERGEGRRGLAGAETVADDAEPTAAGLLGVEELDRAGGEVAGIGVEGFAFGLAQLVEALELGEFHVDLAADLEEVGRAGERARDLADQADVGRHVVAAVAVAARDRAHEPAVLVGEGHRDAVDLGLDDEFEAGAAERLGEPFAEGPEVGFVVGVVERQHRRLVVGLLEALGLVVADAEVGPGEFRVRALEVVQAVDELVEFEVGDLRRVLPAVELLVALDFGAQAEDLIAGGFRHGRGGG